MKTYELEFVEQALKEWRKLQPDLRRQFASKLEERLQQPHVPAARLHGMKDCYKIKLRSSGYRLVYQVDDGVVTVTVIAVGKRDKDDAYRRAAQRI